MLTGDGPEQQFAHVLPDERLYANGGAYDGLAEPSDTHSLKGNPWAVWAELPDGRASLHVLDELALLHSGEGRPRHAPMGGGRLIKHLREP